MPTMPVLCLLCLFITTGPTGTDSLTALDEVAVKICGLITENEAFRQIKTDAVSIAFQKNLNSLEKKINSLKDENQFLRQQVEAQEQYSRRNCLLIHGLPPSQSPTNNDDVACRASHFIELPCQTSFCLFLHFFY